MNYKSGIVQRGRPAVLPYLYGSLLLGLFAILWSATFAKHLVAAEDGATYYVLGKALYQGEGYVSINTPVAIPANNPPPGYPLLVALTMALWSSDFVAIKVVNGVFLMLAILLLFFLFTRLSHHAHLAFVALGYVVAALPWYIRGRSLGGDSYLGPLLSINPYRPELGTAGWSDLALRLYENAQRYCRFAQILTEK